MLALSKSISSPITSTQGSSAYVGIDQSITYGSQGASILSSTAGIIDTGTALLLIASGMIFVSRRVMCTMILTQE